MSRSKANRPKKWGAAKVPVIIQMEATECAAASLAMVLAYYGKWVPLEQVRSDCGVSRDGSNAKNIILAARRYGLNAAGYKMEPLELIKNGHFPCILHWGFDHFVVCCGFKNDKAHINDPALGSIRVTMDEFDKSFTGVCLMFEPADGFVPEGKPPSMFYFVRDRLYGTAPTIGFMFAQTIIAAGLSAAIAVYSRVFMDHLITGRNDRLLLPFMVTLGVFSALRIIAEILRCVYTLRLNGKMAVLGSSSFMWHVLRLPMEFFSQRSAGDILLRQRSNTTIASVFANSAAPLLPHLIMFAFYLGVMLLYSPLLTAVSAGAIAVNILVTHMSANKRRNTARIVMRDRGVLVSATVSGIEIIESIKASGAEDGWFRRWSGYQAAANAHAAQNERENCYLSALPAFIMRLANILILTLGVYLVMHDRISIGMILVFQSLLSGIAVPTDRMMSTVRQLTEMRTDMERINDVTKYPVTAVGEDDTQGGEINKLSGSVTLKNVTFGYSRLAAPLINDLSIDIKQGSRVAIVGASGCGKSTVSKLVSGLYKPWSGEILFDGKSIDDIDRSVFTGSVAVVDQDITLFEDTIANNIRMWDDSIEDFEVILAARDAQLHDDIMQRPGGYEYKLCEGGCDLSGGQRQRLEIARVLAQDPTVVILDEATSALDTKTELEVVNAINQRGITCIVIAHRLSAIRDCDEIIVLENGTITERGTHEQLMEINGHYAALVSNE